MKRIGIDFAHQPMRRNVPAYLLAGLGAAALLAAGLAYAAYSSGQAEWEQEQLELAERQLGQPRQAASVDENAKARQKEAARLQASLEAPWEALFGVLESVPAPQVALLNLSLDGESRELVLSGEALDAAAMHGYARRMGEADGLAGAYLASHEVNAQNPRHSLRFSIGASWRNLARQPQAAGGAP
ncbi:hypothetical protein [Pseudoduganella violacea]|uniref:Tfp pilus assembly protein PilN n=1 Tax=Pseudoduganella violacea TaxID=1715466 RepID=A0A7W5FT43_9BURK|nr:hypothetical protein [Pseudoduganella violacea]MBB3118237.1 Tfp pilus assembly protein PilN [Pseudoduganella violacea]